MRPERGSIARGSAPSPSDSVLGQAQNPITMNRYLYAGANAVTNVDPSGDNYYDPGCDCVRASPISPDKTTVATAPTTSGGGSTTDSSSESGTTTSSTSSVGVLGPNSSNAGDCDRGCEAFSEPGWVTPVNVGESKRLDLTLRTGGWCLSAQSSAGVMLGGQECLVGNLQQWASGNVTLAITGTPFTQGSTGLDASITTGPTLSNAMAGGDYSGWFANAGGSLGEGVVGNLDVSVGKTAANHGVYTFDPSAGYGAEFTGIIPGEFHAGATYTQTVDVNLADIPLPFGNPWQLVQLLEHLSGAAS